MKIYETAVRKPISTILIFVGVIVFGLSVALVRITDHVVAFVTKAFKGMSWRPEVSEAER